MRDPKRIDPIIDQLRVFWKAHPDWRLGQLIVSASGATGASYVFSIEDDALMRGLGKLADKAI